MKPKINMVLSGLSQNEKQELNVLLHDASLKDFSPYTIQLLYTRGIKTPDEIKKFMVCNLADLENTKLMADSDKFVEIVRDAILRDEMITFYTDYDMDGIGSGVTGVKGLRMYADLKASGSVINWYANNRFGEGYGITPGGVDDLVKLYPDTKLIITTDNGIVGFKGVDRAKELGMKIIVTDHHNVSDDGKMVNADAIIDHKRPDNHTTSELCGAGTIYKLLEYLFDVDLGRKEDVYPLLDVVALSTVADMVPLIGDNRIIVNYGLEERVKKNESMHFRILREVYNEMAQSDSAKIIAPDEETFGFTYGPAFNALGRMEGCIDLAMEFFLGTDEQRLREVAQEIFTTNQSRKLATEQANETAVIEYEKMYPTEKDTPPVIAIELDDVPEGIVGLVATYLKDKYYRPSIVFTRSEKEVEENGVKVKKTIYKGSARSIEGFDISKAFSNVKEHLLGFGGHVAAAGLSLEPSKLDDFRNAICAYAEPLLTPALLTPQINIDIAVNVEDLTVDFFDELMEASPFGMSFPKPMVGIKNFTVDRRRYRDQNWESIYCGANKNTVRLVDQTGFSAVMFKHRYRMDEIMARFPTLDNYDLLKLKMVGYPRKQFDTFRQEYKTEFFIENDYLFDETFN